MKVIQILKLLSDQGVSYWVTREYQFLKNDSYLEASLPTGIGVYWSLKYEFESKCHSGPSL